MMIALLFGSPKSNAKMKNQLQSFRDDIAVDYYQNVHDFVSGSKTRNKVYDRIIIKSTVIKPPSNTEADLAELYQYWRSFAPSSEFILFGRAKIDDDVSQRFSTVMCSPLCTSVQVEAITMVTLASLVTSTIAHLNKEYGCTVEIDLAIETTSYEEPESTQDEQSEVSAEEQEDTAVQTTTQNDVKKKKGGFFSKFFKGKNLSLQTGDTSQPQEVSQAQEGVSSVEVSETQGNPDNDSYSADYIEDYDYADEDYADEDYADEDYADEDYADEDYADEDYAEDDYDNNYADEYTEDDYVEEEYTDTDDIADADYNNAYDNGYEGNLTDSNENEYDSTEGYQEGNDIPQEEIASDASIADALQLDEVSVQEAQPVSQEVAEFVGGYINMGFAENDANQYSSEEVNSFQAQTEYAPKVSEDVIALSNDSSVQTNRGSLNFAEADCTSTTGTMQTTSQVGGQNSMSATKQGNYSENPFAMEEEILSEEQFLSEEQLSEDFSESDILQETETGTQEEEFQFDFFADEDGDSENEEFSSNFDGVDDAIQNVQNPQRTYSNFNQTESELRLQNSQSDESEPFEFMDDFLQEEDQSNSVSSQNSEIIPATASSHEQFDFTENSDLSLGEFADFGDDIFASGSDNSQNVMSEAFDRATSNGNAEFTDNTSCNREVVYENTVAPPVVNSVDRQVVNRSLQAESQTSRGSQSRRPHNQAYRKTNSHQEVVKPNEEARDMSVNELPPLDVGKLDTRTSPQSEEVAEAFAFPPVETASVEQTVSQPVQSQPIQSQQMPEESQEVTDEEVSDNRKAKRGKKDKNRGSDKDKKEKKQKKGFLGGLFGSKKKGIDAEDTSSVSEQGIIPQPQAPVVSQPQNTQPVPDSDNRPKLRRQPSINMQVSSQPSSQLQPIQSQSTQSVQPVSDYRPDRIPSQRSNSSQEVVDDFSIEDLYVTEEGYDEEGRAIPQRTVGANRGTATGNSVVEDEDLLDDVNVAELDNAYTEAERAKNVRVERVEVVREVIKEVPTDGKSNKILSSLFAGKINRVFIVTGDRGTGVTSLAYEMVEEISKHVGCLYFDGDVERHGLMNYVSFERICEYDTQKQSGVKLAKSLRALKNCIIRYDNNIDLLTSIFGVEVDDKEFETAQSVVSDVATEYNVIVADIPFEKLHLCEELLANATVIVLAEKSRRGFMNLACAFDDLDLSPRYKRKISSNGLLVLTHGDSKIDVKKLKRYVSDIVEFTEDDCNWIGMKTVEREKMSQKFLQEIIR